jgi:hypothetical protein
MKQRGFVAIVFLIGCATGGVASQLAVPPARAGTTPTRWEYLCQEGADKLVTALNRAGAEGWELTAMIPMLQSRSAVGGELHVDLIVTCFKRALP